MTIPFLGYGSLMSARGLGDQLAGVEDAWLMRVQARRHFHKPAQRGGRLALDVVPPAATLRAGRVGPRLPDPDVSPPSFDCLLLQVREETTDRLVRREGFAPRCWRRLRDAAGERGPAAFLLGLAEEAEGDLLTYRRALREVTGPSDLGACHYLPHPVETGEEAALIFVAPEPGATGDPALPSAKARYPLLRPALLDELLGRAPEFPELHPRLQTEYVELCLLGAAHGIDVSDLFGAGLTDGHPVAALLASWEGDPTPLLAERAALRRIPALRSEPAYAERFPASLADALARSRLPRSGM